MLRWLWESDREKRLKKEAELKEKSEDLNYEMYQKYGKALKELKTKKKTKTTVFSRPATIPEEPEPSCFAKLFPCCAGDDDDQPEAKQVGHRVYKKI